MPSALKYPLSWATKNGAWVPWTIQSSEILTFLTSAWAGTIAATRMTTAAIVLTRMGGLRLMAQTILAGASETQHEILRLGDRLQLAEPFLELAADHLVAIDEHGHELGQERLAAAHRPCHRGGVAVRRKCELHRGMRLHGLLHVEPHGDPERWRCIGDLDAPFTDLAVAAPGVRGAPPASRPPVPPFNPRLRLDERIPCVHGLTVADER